MRPLAFLAGLLLCLLSLSTVQAQPVQSQPSGLVAFGPQRTVRIEAELVPMSQWVAPGSTTVVAVRQKIAPGWHTYWRNPGDSGGATSLVWTLPDGVTADPILWPLPSRQRLMSLMNYGYSGAVLLPVPIHVPASAQPGEVLTLTTDVLFLVCSDQMCVPEPLTLSLALPVRDGAAPLAKPWGGEIERLVETAPRPAGIEARVTADAGKLTLTATGGPLVGTDVGQAYFYPFDGGRIDHAAVQTGEKGSAGLSLTLTPGRGAAAAPLVGVLATDKGAWEITAQPGPPLAGAQGRGALAPLDEAAKPEATGLLAFAQALGLALLGGLVLNLMPCVFPVLAMKAASLSAAAHDPARARRDGLAFTIGVLISFLALAGALLALRAAGQAIGWGFQLQSPGVVAALALIMLLVGLNLSGVFHVGAGLQNAGSGPLSRLPGAAGAFFTGVLAVVVAAPCTAPFMAAALGAALVLPWPMALAVFLMLGLGLALPYLAISLSPGLLSRLPRPGGWMERLKGVLAFPMYGAALWLIWVFTRQGGADALGLLLIAALMLAFGAWLFGLAQTGRQEGGRPLIATVAATLACVMAIGLAGVAAGAAREPGPSSSDGEGGPLAAQPWSPEAVAQATAAGRPVLVNLTADWCVTCKINERAALSSPRVAKAMAQANAAYLVGDWTRRDDAITRELQAHGRSGVPLYLLYRPGQAEPEILPQLLTEGVVIDALEN